MGCDIHFYVETKQDDGHWKSVDEWVTKEDYKYIPYEKRLYSGRNYDLFAILADVRNGRGFAGVVTGEGFNPISQPRGLPLDVSPEVAESSNSWGCDGHSHSWLTVAELKAFNWTQRTGHQGIVNENEFKVFLKKGKPESWCGGVAGGGCEQVSYQEMISIIEGRMAKQEGKKYYTRVSWSEPYSESAKLFLTETLPKMESLGNADSVRCVFWFDN